MGRKKVEPDPRTPVVLDRALGVAKERYHEMGPGVEFANYMKTSRQALHAWRKKMRIPYAYLVESFNPYEWVYIFHGDAHLKELYKRAPMLEREHEKCKVELMKVSKEVEELRVKCEVLSKIVDSISPTNKK